MAMAMARSLESLRFFCGECEVRGFVRRGAVGLADRSHERFSTLRVWCGKKKERNLSGKLAKVQELVKVQRELVLLSSAEQEVRDPIGDLQAENTIQIAISNPGVLERIIKNLEDLQAEVESLNVKSKKKKSGSPRSSSSESSDIDMTERFLAARSTSNLVEDEEPAIVAQIRALCSTANPSSREIYSRGPIELKDTSAGRIIVDTISSSLLSSLVDPVSSTSGTMEVCTVGKCKRGGSQQILASLQGCIPESSSISLTSCKCMGKCKSAPNVRVRNSEGQTQIHSHVSMDDVDALLEMHFGVQASASQSSAMPLFFARTDSGLAAA